MSNKDYDTATKIIRVLIADDHQLIRHAIKSFIAEHSDINVIAEASDGEEAIKFATTLCPDVVLMDLGMPKINGIEAIIRIKEKCPQIAILVLTVHCDYEHILRVLKAGAAGYLMKDVFGDELVTSIRAVISGETILSPQISKQLVNYAVNFYNKPANENTCDILTSREIEILSFAAQGMNNKAIANEMSLSPLTIKKYFADIFSKLCVGSRTEAVITALRSGIIKLE